MGRVRRTDKGQDERTRYKYLIDKPEVIQKSRKLIRNCYAYGYKSRDEYLKEFGHVLSRQYQMDETVAFWVNGYQKTRANHKNDRESIVSIVVAGSEIAQNPLYGMFHAKTPNEQKTAAYFYITDLLRSGPMTRQQLLDAVNRRVNDWFPSDTYFDLISGGTLNNYLKEFVSLGILQKDGHQYRLADDLPLPDAEALLFATEQLPLGVIGSFLSDLCASVPDDLRFKHHYLLGALDSLVLYPLLCAANAQTPVSCRMDDKAHAHTLVPYRFLFGTQTGRQYVLGYDTETERPLILRLDRITSATPLPKTQAVPIDRDRMDAALSKLWNASGDFSAEGLRKAKHLEMTLRIEEGEEYVIARLNREKKHGVVEQLDARHWRFSIDVSDPLEMLPWIRTFTGRIVDLKSPDDPRVLPRFVAHLKKQLQQYGVKTDGK